MSVNCSDLIYDWNNMPGPDSKPSGPVLLNDESLRDGLQSPSVRDPSIPEKIEILHLMEGLGINSLDIGLPGAGPRAVEHATALAREIVSHKMKIKANCAAPWCSAAQPRLGRDDQRGRDGLPGESALDHRLRRGRARRHRVRVQHARRRPQGHPGPTAPPAVAARGRRE